MKAIEHPNYENCMIEMDRTLDLDKEDGRILKISPTREGFDEYYEDLYLDAVSELREIKVGNDYVLFEVFKFKLS